VAWRGGVASIAGLVALVHALKREAAARNTKPAAAGHGLHGFSVLISQLRLTRDQAQELFSPHF
jgi:hypothetical protein